MYTVYIPECSTSLHGVSLIISCATITTTYSKLLTLTYVNPLTHKKYPTILCYHLARIQTNQNKRQISNLHKKLYIRAK